MSFRNLQNALESQPDYYDSQQSEMLQRVRGKPLWIWDSFHHKDKERVHKGDCCFTDICGRPRKNGNGNGRRMPFFDYQKMLYMALFRPSYLNSAKAADKALYPFKEKHLQVLKAL